MSLIENVSRKTLTVTQNEYIMKYADIFILFDHMATFLCAYVNISGNDGNKFLTERLEQLTISYMLFISKMFIALV